MNRAGGSHLATIFLNVALSSFARDTGATQTNPSDIRVTIDELASGRPVFVTRGGSGQSIDGLFRAPSGHFDYPAARRPHDLRCDHALTDDSESQE